MSQKYYPKLTHVGLAKLTNAALLNKQVSLTHMAVGDGSGSSINLDAKQLEHEVYRAQINEIRLDESSENTVLAVLVIPVQIGGFHITELGLFDSDGDLIAVGLFPATYKPTLDEGTGREIRVQMKLQLQNPDAVTLSVDPSAVMATKHELSTHLKDPTPHGLPLNSGEAGQVLIKQADGGTAWGAISGVPVGQLCFSTNGEALAGTIPVNVKQKVRCDLYPQLFEWMKGGAYLTDEAVWDAEAAAQDGTCGKFCWDGGEWFILPCYRHHFAAATVENPVGTWQPDDIKSHIHDLYVSPGLAAGQFGDVGNSQTTQKDGFVTAPTGGTETRPKTSYVLPCIKAFDVPINAAHVDMLALAQQVAAINGNKVDRSEWVELVPDRAWRLPNGLILQTAPTGEIVNNSVVTFPVAFNSPPFSVVLGDGAGPNTLSVYSYTAVSFITNTNGSAEAYYMAIGR